MESKMDYLIAFLMVSTLVLNGCSCADKNQKQQDHLTADFPELFEPYSVKITPSIYVLFLRASAVSVAVESTGLCQVQIIYLHNRDWQSIRGTLLMKQKFSDLNYYEDGYPVIVSEIKELQQYTLDDFVFDDFNNVIKVQVAFEDEINSFFLPDRTVQRQIDDFWLSN